MGKNDEQAQKSAEQSRAEKALQTKILTKGHNSALIKKDKVNNEAEQKAAATAKGKRKK